MNEESKTVGNMEFSKYPLYPEQESAKENIMMSLEKYEELLETVELLFNAINDRFPGLPDANKILTKIEAIKKKINEAKT